MLEILYWEVSVWFHQADARLPVVWSKLQVQADARAHDLCERMLTPGVYLGMNALNAGVCIDNSIVVY